MTSSRMPNFQWLGRNCLALLGNQERIVTSGWTAANREKTNTGYKGGGCGLNMTLTHEPATHTHTHTHTHTMHSLGEIEAKLGQEKGFSARSIKELVEFNSDHSESVGNQIPRQNTSTSTSTLSDFYTQASELQTSPPNKESASSMHDSPPYWFHSCEMDEGSAKTVRIKWGRPVWSRVPSSCGLTDGSSEYMRAMKAIARSDPGPNSISHGDYKNSPTSTEGFLSNWKVSWTYMEEAMHAKQLEESWSMKRIKRPSQFHTISLLKGRARYSLPYLLVERHCTCWKTMTSTAQ